MIYLAIKEKFDEFEEIIHKAIKYKNWNKDFKNNLYEIKKALVDIEKLLELGDD